MASQSTKTKIENIGQVSPDEVALVETSLKGPEQAPRIVESTGTFVNWQQMRDDLGQPFDVDRIPLNKRRLMRRDAMFGFGLHYRKTPLVRAKYHFEARDKNGPNAQIAGFFDSAWRQIHARYIFQHTEDWTWGSAQTVLRYAQGNPGGVYEDLTENDPVKRLKPVWDEGTLQPYVWKTPVGVPLWKVSPYFDTNGDYAGFVYDPTATSDNPITVQQDPNTNALTLTKDQRIIDKYHGLWATNEKDSSFNSLYGYPLLGYGYRYWWSYWYRWAMADRAFERMAVPPLIAYHPDGEYTDPDSGETRPYFEIAAEAAQNLRSNFIATVPSTLATAGIEERGTQEREWSFEFLEVQGQNFEWLDKSFNYLDVMKLRSIWVPEQAFIEGEGGSSSRNVAAQMAEIFLESQANKWEEIAFHINNYIIPTLLTTNFPEFVNNGGTCRIVGHGFASEDVDFMKQLIQLVGQDDPSRLGEIDMREMMRRANIPLLTPEAYEAEQNRIAARQAAQGPPSVPGVTAPLNPGQTNGGSVPEPNAAGSATGFSDEPHYIYVQPNDVIELSDADDFLAGLPNTPHFADKALRSLALQFRKLFQGFYREIYKDFSKYVAGIDSVAVDAIKLGEDDTGMLALSDRREFTLELAERKKISITRARRATNKILSEWTSSAKRIERLTKSAQRLIDKATRRSITNAQRNLGFSPVEHDEDSLTQWIESQTGALIKSVTGTVKKELQTHLINEITEGKTADEIALSISEHFSDFEGWKADRVAVSEIRDAHNAGTLLAGESLKLKYAQASDGVEHDEECRQRNGKLFTIKEAWREMRHGRTHPWCALGFTLVPRAEFSVVSVTQLPEAAGEGALAYFDSETYTAYVPVELGIKDADEFLYAVVNHMLDTAGVN